MSREIKFRGLKKYSREWIYGMPTYDFTHIFNDDNVDSPDSYEVDTDTLGQFTGLTDRNGKDIYSGDAIQNEAMKIDKIYWIVEFDRGCFGAKGMALRAMKEMEVIGNAHEKHLLP
jgi:uncharacterized phage protein (TIGR01671 family)